VHRDIKPRQHSWDEGFRRLWPTLGSRCQVQLHEAHHTNIAGTVLPLIYCTVLFGTVIILNWICAAGSTVTSPTKRSFQHCRYCVRVYHTASYSIALCCTVTALYCTVLYGTVLYCTVLYWTIQYSAVLCLSEARTPGVAGAERAWGLVRGAPLGRHHGVHRPGAAFPREGDPAGPDVYSFGVVLLELVIRRPGHHATPGTPYPQGRQPHPTHRTHRTLPVPHQYRPPKMEVPLALAPWGWCNWVGVVSSGPGVALAVGGGAGVDSGGSPGRARAVQ